MKVLVTFVLVFALIILIIPMFALTEEKQEYGSIQTHQPFPSQETMRSSNSETVETQVDNDLGDASPVSGYLEGAAQFKILNLSTGKVDEVSYKDYVRGAVALEMLPDFHTEALKAQAVAAHTYALSQHRKQIDHPSADLQGADFAADPENRVGYVTEKQAKEMYGNQFDYYWSKICESADSVCTYVMTYDEEPIVAAYHAMSAGVTEDAGNVWESSVPYLQPVPSEGDIFAPDYHTTAAFSRDQAADILRSAYPDIELPEDPSEWFTDIVSSDSGYILSVTAGEQEIPGKEIRQLFGLRSHNLEISCSGSGLQFDVYGYGHGVGMSQYGADFLARQGYTFDRILETYYSGIQLEQILL